MKTDSSEFVFRNVSLQGRDLFLLGLDNLLIWWQYVEKHMVNRIEANSG